MPSILRKTEAWKGKNKNREAGLDQKLRIVLSLIWPEIKNYEAEPIWGILIKKKECIKYLVTWVGSGFTVGSKIFGTDGSGVGFPWVFVIIIFPVEPFSW